MCAVYVECSDGRLELAELSMFLQILPGRDGDMGIWS